MVQWVAAIAFSLGYEALILPWILFIHFRCHSSNVILELELECYEGLLCIRQVVAIALVLDMKL